MPSLRNNILAAIRANPGHTQTELREICYVEHRGTMSKIANRLERLEYVKHDEHDCFFPTSKSGFPDPVSEPRQVEEEEEAAPETAPELLNGNLSLALKRDREILKWPFDRDDAKTCNMIVATSTATKAAAIKVDQNRLMAERNPDALERVINRVAQLVEEERAAGRTPPEEWAELADRRAAQTNDVAPPRQLATVIEEPPREPDFNEFHRIKSAQEPVEQDDPLVEEPPQNTPINDPGAAYRRYQRTGVMPPLRTAAKGAVPAPGPTPSPEAQREMSAVDQAFTFKFER